MLELVLAVAPAIVLMALIYKFDTADKEPWPLVLKCFFLGMAVIIPIGIIECIADAFFADIFGEGSDAYLFWFTLLGIALVEELFKMGAALMPTWKNNEFNYVFDGILYCAAAALGYACLENICYVCFDAGDAMLETAIVRALVSVPSHMVDGILMGTFVGFAKLCKYQSKKQRVKGFLALALLVPMAEHCAFDYLGSLETDAAGIILFCMVLVEYVVAFILVAKLHGKHDILIPLPQAAKAEVSEEASEGEEPAEQPADQPAEPTEAAPAPAPAPSAPKFCTACGAKLDGPGAKFCSECGEPVA